MGIMFCKVDFSMIFKTIGELVFKMINFERLLTNYAQTIGYYPLFA